MTMIVSTQYQVWSQKVFHVPQNCEKYLHVTPIFIQQGIHVACIKMCTPRTHKGTYCWKAYIP